MNNKKLISKNHAPFHFERDENYFDWFIVHTETGQEIGDVEILKENKRGWKIRTNYPTGRWQEHFLHRSDWDLIQPTLFD